MRYGCRRTYPFIAMATSLRPKLCHECRGWLSAVDICNGRTCDVIAGCEPQRTGGLCWELGQQHLRHQHLVQGREQGGAMQFARYGLQMPDGRLFCCFVSAPDDGDQRLCLRSVPPVSQKCEASVIRSRARVSCTHHSHGCTKFDTPFGRENDLSCENKMARRQESARWRRCRLQA